MSEERPQRPIGDPAPEADALEQARDWVEDDEEEEPSKVDIPVDAPEADVIDQHRPADLDDEEAPG